MYTAKLIKREVDQGRYKWTVEFTDGVNKWFEYFYDAKYEQVRLRVAYKLKDLNDADSFTEDAAIDATIPPIVQPTQAEIDRGAWLRDWEILKKANELIAQGVIVNTLPVYVAHKNKVSNNFKVEYVNYL